MILMHNSQSLTCRQFGQTTCSTPPLPAFLYPQVGTTLQHLRHDSSLEAETVSTSQLNIFE